MHICLACELDTVFFFFYFSGLLLLAESKNNQWSYIQIIVTKETAWVPWSIGPVRRE
jgi:hypothetical protein